MRAIFVTRTTLMGLLLGGLLFMSPVQAAEWGDLTVRFTYDGAVPVAQKVVVTKDKEVCGKIPLYDESLVVNKENKGIQNVICYLYLGRRDKQPSVHPSYAESSKATLSLDNNLCRFEPHIQIVRTGQPLDVLNTDPVGHNTNVSTLTNPAQNILIPGGGKVSMKFAKEERLPAKVACNIHPWMSGYVVVRENPYAAVSDEDGNLTIKNLPAGKHTFQFWHEKSGYVSAGKQNGKAVTWKRGRVELDVKPSGTKLGEIKLAPALFK